MIKTLQNLKISNRDIYLYDTFEGFANPSKYDSRNTGSIPLTWNEKDKKKYATIAPIEEVKKAVYDTNYPKSKLHFIKGEVEKTLPNNEIDKIALIRLNTDWYKSTKCELEHLFPKLVTGGVLYVDSYSHWAGARKALNDYIKQNNIHIFLNRLYPVGGVIGIKQPTNTFHSKGVSS